MWLINPKSMWKKVALETINGFGGEHKFCFVTISDTQFKIDVYDAHAPNVVLMFQNKADDQEKVKDAIGPKVHEECLMKVDVALNIVVLQCRKFCSQRYKCTQQYLEVVTSFTVPHDKATN